MVTLKGGYIKTKSLYGNCGEPSQPLPSQLFTETI